MRLRGARVASAVLLIGTLLTPASAGAQAVPTTRPSNDELRSVRAADKDWITYGGSMYNQRYSVLDQINTSNISQLKGAWLSRLGSGRGSKYRFEADPLVVDGVMYIPTGNDDIFALDAKNGRKIWEYYSDIPQTNDTVCCGWNNRGVGAGDGRIYSGQLDATVVGLDQMTGRVLWKTQLEDYREGFSITGATRFIDGLVFTGMSGGEYGVRGRIYALDAATGREVWRFYTIPGPGEVGHETWPINDPDPLIANIWKNGGATVWQAPAIDPELGMLYFTTGNAGPREGSMRPGENLFTASMVALDYRTGQYRWHFQMIIHEIWDYDMPNPPVLFDQMYNGQMRKGIVHAGKSGWLYFIDRTNGEPLIGMEYRPVPPDPYPGASEKQNAWPVQPYPVGDAYVDQCPEPMAAFPFQANQAGCIYTSYWDVPVLLRPPNNGGTNWSPTSYHPPTGYVFVNGNEANQATTVDTYAPREHTVGKNYTRQVNAPVPGSSLSQTYTAMDSRTNKIVWQHRMPGGQGYGWASTAGNLAFAGNVDGNLQAFNAQTGEILWKFQTGWAVGAPPMVYSVDGVQYVAVASGGNRGGFTTLDGDAVWAFSLNGTIDEVASPGPVQTKVPSVQANVRLGGEVGNAVTLGGTWIFEGTIRTLDFRFDPPGAIVPQGTVVNFTNMGSSIHTATEVRGAWDTGDFGAGETRSITFSGANTYDYLCKPHPWMIGRIQVTE